MEFYILRCGLVKGKFENGLLYHQGTFFLGKSSGKVGGYPLRYIYTDSCLKLTPQSFEFLAYQLNRHPFFLKIIHAGMKYKIYLPKILQ